MLPGHPDLLAEAVHAARREQARTVGDVLLRRTRLGLTGARALLRAGRAGAPSASRPRWARSRAGTARACAAEAEAFRAEAAAEGVWWPCERAGARAARPADAGSGWRRARRC